MINMLMILKDTNLNKKNDKVISILKSIILLEKPNNLIGSTSLGKIYGSVSLLVADVGIRLGKQKLHCPSISIL